MFNLNKNWLTSTPIDLEYKTYLILDYEQKIIEKFESYEIYPYFDDLLDKLLEAKTFIDNKYEIDNRQKTIIKVDIVNEKIVYKNNIFEDRIEIFEDVAAFAYKRFKKCYILGEAKFENLYKSIYVTDLNLNGAEINFSGLIVLDMSNRLKIYKYHLIKFIDNNEYCYGINLDLIKSIPSSTKCVDGIHSNSSENIFLLKTEFANIDDLSLMTIIKKKMINHLSRSLTGTCDTSIRVIQ